MFGFFSKKPKISQAELQLKQEQAQNSLRIIQESIKLVSETKNPEVFFSRYNLLIEHSKILLTLESYVNFTGAPLLAAYEEVLNNRQIATKDFLIRYWSDTLLKIDALKTESAKKKKLQVFYNSLEKCKEEMSAENIDYYTTKYKNYYK